MDVAIAELLRKLLDGDLTMSHDRTPKKNGTIELRVAEELKAEFADRCRDDGVSVSEALRSLMAERLSPKVSIDERGGSRTRIALAGFVGAILGVSVAAPSFAHAASVSHPTFRQLDLNHDGVLTPAEFNR